MFFKDSAIVEEFGGGGMRTLIGKSFVVMADCSTSQRKYLYLQVDYFLLVPRQPYSIIFLANVFPWSVNGTKFLHHFNLINPGGDSAQGGVRRRAGRQLGSVRTWGAENKHSVSKTRFFLS